LSAALLLVVAEPALVYVAAHFLPQGRARGVAAAASEFARSVPGILCATLASSTVLGLTAWASARLQGGRVAVNLRIGPSRGSLAGTAATVVGTVGLGLASGSAADLLGVGRSGSMNTMATVLSHASGLQIVGAMVTIAILPAVAEESLFRGLLQGLLVRRLGRWAGIVAASALFGLIHFDLVQGVLAALIGLFLGWAAERLDGIRPGMLAHAVNNGLFVLTSIGPNAECTPPRTVWELGAAGGIAWAVAWRVLRRPEART
jgi:membrane protease YdiL (CAAX protease family)